MNNNLQLYDDFMAGTEPDRLQKIIARYELFKQIIDKPGDIVECGVFKGSGFFTWVKLLQIFKPNSPCGVVGFDFFDTNREQVFQHELDASCLDEHQDGWRSREDILNTCKDWGFPNVELHAGNVIETTKRYAVEQLGARISLLYLDVDNYEGSLACLENLYPLVVRGGLVVFDEYALRTYGESDAVDEFFRDMGVTISCLPWANTPSAYIVKP